ncbi:MAG: PilZ domain-containing protein [Treponema sp.]|nr:PilZ domain-containing protein [Treponema sp.]
MIYFFFTFVSMLENRRSTRYHTNARAHIPGVLREEIFLKNISITGCCVESKVFSNVAPNSSYNMEIEPETAAGIEMFSLVVECKWIRSGRHHEEIGFNISSPPKCKLFQRYVDYLSCRAALA